MSDDCSIFHQCLYFTANSLCRVLTRMAEEEFAVTGLSPSYAFLLMLAEQAPGMAQKDLADALNLAPSTITRFIDKLERQGLLERRTQGRTVHIYPTQRGLALRPTVTAAWEALYERYKAILGEAAARDLTRAIDEAVTQLEQTDGSR